MNSDYRFTRAPVLDLLSDKLQGQDPAAATFDGTVNSFCKVQLPYVFSLQALYSWWNRPEVLLKFYILTKQVRVYFHFGEI